MGTLRSKFYRGLILALNREVYSQPIISYIHTGIIKKRWNRKVVDQLLEYDVNFDFTKRGFYIQKHKLLNKLETIIYLIKSPINLIISIMNLIYLYGNKKFK